MRTFRQEDVTDATEQDITDSTEEVRYYVEKDEDKYYIMVTSDGNIATLNADDLVVDSANDFKCRFTIVHG